MLTESCIRTNCRTIQKLKYSMGLHFAHMVEHLHCCKMLTVIQAERKMFSLCSIKFFLLHLPYPLAQSMVLSRATSSTPLALQQKDSHACTHRYKMTKQLECIYCTPGYLTVAAAAVFLHLKLVKLSSLHKLRAFFAFDFEWQEFSVALLIVLDLMYPQNFLAASLSQSMM